MIYSYESEHAVLGAALFAPERCGEAFERLRPDHFYEATHGDLWRHIGDVAREFGHVDPRVVLSRMADHKGLTDLGGLVFLSDLVDQANPATVASHVEVVADRAMRRALLELGKEAMESAQTLDASAFHHVAQTERRITSLLHEAAPSENNLVDARTSVAATMDELREEARVGKAKGAMTGLRCFDYRMRGLRPGWLVVIAGRPGMAKTALARATAMGCARRNPKSRVVFFALEMARRELDERTLAQLSWEAGDGIAYRDMNGDTLPPEDLSRLGDLAFQVPSNFLIDDSPILSVEYVRRRVLALKRKGPLAAVFIDYLQIMDRPDGKGRNEASVIGEMTKQLKQLAREAQTCVVLLSQINRGVESRDDKRPQLSDLRESGAIEQDANAVFFPYREVYYIERNPPKPDASTDKIQQHQMLVEEYRRRMDVICAKLRQGAVGTDQQVYFAEYDVIEDVRDDYGRAA